MAKGAKAEGKKAKASTSSKRKRADEDEDNNGDDGGDEELEEGGDDDQEEEEEEVLPAKRSRTKTKPMEIEEPAPRSKAKAKDKEKEKEKGKGKGKAEAPTKKKGKKVAEEEGEGDGEGDGDGDEGSVDGAPRKAFKDMTKMAKLDEARKAFKWWEADELPDDINWRSMEHAGIAFPPPYEKHGIPLLYDGEAITLPAPLEEIATFYAAMPTDGPQLGDEKTRNVFNKNFFRGFSEALGPGHKIEKFSKCDFKRIREYVNDDRALKKAATKQEKEQTKAEKDAVALKRGWAIVDGRLEKMGNFNMEPPGLFRGRGSHPKTGELKQRTMPESVSINIGIDAPVPKTDLVGHSWQEVRHDPSVTWLCSWNENVQGSNKYVMLSASSSFKGKSDRDKYAKAIQLKHCINKVRKDYNEKILSANKADREIGVAMWVIDILALRVGGEKGEDEADTVGCCSLRKEHLHFNKDKDSFEIELEFLGKDSMLYKQTIDFAKHGDTGKRVYGCLKAFVAGRKEEDDVFETLTPSDLNKHLASIMKGLTAKVFRTFNASVTCEKELPSAEELEGLDVGEKIVRYNAANREVAILCNHQKTVSKAAETQLEKLGERLEMLRDQKKVLGEWRDLLKKNKANQIPLSDDDGSTAEAIAERVRKATEQQASAKTNEEKIAAKKELDEAKAEQKKVRPCPSAAVAPSLSHSMHLSLMPPPHSHLNNRTATASSRSSTCTRRRPPSSPSKTASKPGPRASESSSSTCRTGTRTRTWPLAPARSTTSTPASVWLGASAARCPLRKSSPKPSWPNSTGRWLFPLTGFSPRQWEMQGERESERERERERGESGAGREAGYTV